MKMKACGRTAKDLQDFQIQPPFFLFFSSSEETEAPKERNYLIKASWNKGVNCLPPGPQHKVVQVGHCTKATGCRDGWGMKSSSQLN